MTDDRIVAAMARYGGGFVTMLAELYRRADPENRARIKAAWPEYWEKYAELAALAAVVPR